MAIYFIGDLHLFAKSQTNEGSINYDGRPFDTVAEMNKTILENHNKRVTNGDSTVFVGDMSMRGRSDELVALVAQMKGRKILVKGNHDDVSDYRYASCFIKTPGRLPRATHWSWNRKSRQRRSETFLRIWVI